MEKRIDKYGLKIEENLFNFINNEVLDNLDFEKESFRNEILIDALVVMFGIYGVDFPP